jgi:hypothetical protein
MTSGDGGIADDWWRFQEGYMRIKAITGTASLVGIVTFSALAQPLPAGSPPETKRTVSWYIAHPEVLPALKAWCQDDPGHLSLNPDCINAEKAGMELSLQKMNNQLKQAK